MKTTFLTIAALLFSVQSFADNNCKMSVGQPAEKTAGMVSNSMNNMMMMPRSMMMMDMSMNMDAQPDFYIDFQTLEDSQGKKFMLMTVDSQKMMSMMHEIKDCTMSSTVMTTTAMFSDAISTARQLMINVPSCEILKNLEAEMMKKMKCN